MFSHKLDLFYIETFLHLKDRCRSNANIFFYEK